MVTFDEKAVFKKEFIDVGFFYDSIKERFNLRAVAGEEGFDRRIETQNIHRPGLALAGFLELFAYRRVQVFGNTETRFLASLSDKRRLEALERIFQFEVPCLVFTNNNKPDECFLKLCEEYNIPAFVTPFSTTKASYVLGDFLDDQFSLKYTMHGSFVDVYGVGILFTGKSGVGKSEVALDLVERGHRLVADDVVIITKKHENILMGSGAELSKHFMEIRGLGLVNVAKMFGVRSVRFQKRLEVIVELEIWDEKQEYERTGLSEKTVEMFEVDVPYVKLPIVSGKNLTVIAEVIALDYLLKHYGYDGARDFQHRLQLALERKGAQPIEGAAPYFEHDFE
jgi:HPr kinase/phosphorylase